MHLSTGILSLALCALALGGEIKNLPGAPATNFKQYAGYFDVGENQGHHLHYWFVESQGNPSTDPVLLWLTGGPGCSGLSALLTEWGPFMVNQDGKTLRANPYSWNKHANILTLEAPAGVGFSYTDDGNVATDDAQTAEENWEALRAFFKQFPRFAKNDFYVTGESYGGVYVPTLVDTILKKQGDFNINIKGFVIGNGCVSANLGTDTIIQFTYNHGMIDEDSWQKTKRMCCNGAIDGCPFHTFDGFGYCASFAQEAANAAWYSGLNPYNMYANCYQGDNNVRPKQSRYEVDYQLRTGRQLPAKYESVMCLDETPVTDYLNQQSVRQALFVPDSVSAWSICNGAVSQEYNRGDGEMGDIVKNALNQGLRGLLYNGDVDMACNFLMGQRFSANLGRAQVSAKQEFKVDGQIGGFHTSYDNLDFISVRGAGHMVPSDKPSVAFHIINAFLNKRNP